MNPYQELLVPPDADFPEVRYWYKRLARNYHPDKRGPEGTAKMQLLSQARAILLDPVARKIFDMDKKIDDCFCSIRRDEITHYWPGIEYATSWPYVLNVGLSDSDSDIAIIEDEDGEGGDGEGGVGECGDG